MAFAQRGKNNGAISTSNLFGALLDEDPKKKKKKEKKEAEAAAAAAAPLQDLKPLSNMSMNWADCADSDGNLSYAMSHIPVGRNTRCLSGSFSFILISWSDWCCDCWQRTTCSEMGLLHHHPHSRFQLARSSLARPRSSSMQSSATHIILLQKEEEAAEEEEEEEEEEAESEEVKIQMLPPT